MKANELRIGNWVLANGTPQKVARIDYDAAQCSIEGLEQVYSNHRFTWDSLSPIPLTEEWLLRFGFENDTEFCVLNFSGGSWREGKGIYLSWSKNPAYENDRLTLCKDTTVLTSFPIQHVHQLQNLYFALMGEELEYNP